MVLVDWRFWSQFKRAEERWGRVRVGVGWGRLERERGLSEDGRAIGAIAASSPMVFFSFFFFFFSVVVIAMR
jgi:hypothetical protein